METQLPEVITKHFIVTESPEVWDLKCKGCDKTYKVAKPAQGKAINNLVLRNITKHTTSHPYPEDDLGEEMEDTMFGGDRALQLAHERGSDTSYDDHGEPVALPLFLDTEEIPLPAYPNTYQVTEYKEMYNVARIESVHVYTNPHLVKTEEGGYVVHLHAANREHAEAVAKGLIEKAKAAPKKRLTWKDKRKARAS